MFFLIQKLYKALFFFSVIINALDSLKLNFLNKSTIVKVSKVFPDFEIIINNVFF